MFEPQSGEKVHSRRGVEAPIHSQARRCNEIDGLGSVWLEVHYFCFVELCMWRCSFTWLFFLFWRWFEWRVNKE